MSNKLPRKEASIKRNKFGNVKELKTDTTYKEEKGKFTKNIYYKFEPQAGLSKDDYPVYAIGTCDYDDENFDFDKLIELQIKIFALTQECDEKYIKVITEEQYYNEFGLDKEEK